MQEIGNVRFAYMVDAGTKTGGTATWEPQPDGSGIVRLVKRDPLTGRTDRISLAVVAKPASSRYPGCADGVTLVTGMEANGVRADGFELDQVLSGLFRQGEEPVAKQSAAASTPPLAAAPTAPSGAPANAADQQEVDEDGDYYAGLAPYREFQVRVAAADGTPVCCLTIGAMIDRFQNEDAEIRMDPDSNDHLDMLVVQHRPQGTETTRYRFTSGRDPGQGWRLDSISDGTGRNSYSSSASSYARTPDAYLVVMFRLAGGNMQ